MFAGFGKCQNKIKKQTALKNETFQVLLLHITLTLKIKNSANKNIKKKLIYNCKHVIMKNF